MSEQWRPVPGYEGSYSVSDHGRVRSEPRVIVCRDKKRRLVVGCIRVAGLNPAGYLTVTLPRPDGGLFTVKVHRMVLTAFEGPQPSDILACHVDGNPLNNMLSNLYWGSASDNMQDRLRHGNDPQANRTHCPRVHALQLPNLVPNKLKRGSRYCLACNRATSLRGTRLKAGLPVEGLQELSDWYYARIMAA